MRGADGTDNKREERQFGAQGGATPGMATLSIDPTVVALTDPASAEAEAFRIIRANLHFSGLTHRLRSVLVTSALPSEGKTLVATNLAAVCAGTGQKVLLLDGDLRLPSVQRSFGVDPLPGLAGVLTGEVPLEDALVGVMETLAVCPAGMPPANPAELLGSTRLPQLLDDATRLADLVIIDGPPVLPVADAALWAGAADGVILVVTAGRTRAPLVIRALAALQRARARVLGVVLDRAGPSGADARYAVYYQPRRGGKHAPRH